MLLEDVLALHDGAPAHPAACLPGLPAWAASLGPGCSLPVGSACLRSLTLLAPAPCRRPAGQPGAPIIFGCETRETGEIYKQRADGLFGLGNSDASGAALVCPGVGCPVVCSNATPACRLPLLGHCWAG